MRPALGPFVLGLTVLLRTSVSSGLATSPFGVSASAPEATLAIASDRAAAGRAVEMNFTV